MAAFRFKAMDDAGKPQNGMLEAISLAAARQQLRARNLLPLEVVASAKSDGNKADRSKPALNGTQLRAAQSGPRMPLASLTLFTRQMATLLGSGLRIEDALSTIAQGMNPKVAGTLLNVRASVLEGRSFGDALASYPLIFSDFYRASVRAGEQAGKLDQVMTHLAGFVENRARNRQTVQLALLYPALLAVVSLSIITLLMAFVVPDIVRVFTSRGTDLPFLTRALIAVSALVRGYGLYAALGLMAAIFAWTRWVRVPQNRLRWHRVLAEGRSDRKTCATDERQPICRNSCDFGAKPRAVDRGFGGRRRCHPKPACPRPRRRSHRKSPPRHQPKARDGRSCGVPADAGGDGRQR